MPEYETLYSAAAGIPDGLVVYLGAIAFLVICWGLARRRGALLNWTFAALLVFWTGFFALTMGFPSWKLRRALEEGRCDLVEGRVEDFVAQPADGKGVDESFRVGTRTISYSYYRLGPGYHSTVAHGARQIAGKQVRICLVGDIIAKIEVAR